MASTELHEPESRLTTEVVDLHRGITSIIEEFEAIDWYHQRAMTTDDPELRALLEHNRDEEKEHASMLLEWLRRCDAKLNDHLRTYLFSHDPIVEVEHETEARDEVRAHGSLGIGSLRGLAAS